MAFLVEEEEGGDLSRALVAAGVSGRSYSLCRRYGFFLFFNSWLTLTLDVLLVLLFN